MSYRYNSALAQEMMAAGYVILPIKPGEKAPAAKGWTDEGYAPPGGYHGCGVGVACCRGAHSVIAIDIDITDAALAGAMREFADRLLGAPAPYRVGKAPKCIIVCRHAGGGASRRSSRRYACGQVEILGRGQQFVAAGVHPDTKTEYAWPGISIFDTPAASLPELTDAQIDALLREFERRAEEAGFAPASAAKAAPAPNREPYDPDDPLDRPPPIEGLTIADAHVMLADVSPDCDRKTWINIGMGLHYQFGGSVEGRQVWDVWSSRSATKYKAHEIVYYWNNFGKNKTRPVTAATLIKTVRDAVAGGEDDGPAPDPEEEAAPAAEPAPGGENVFESMNWSTGRFLAEAPPQETVVDGLIPRGAVGMLYSMGGAGKSTLALFLAVRIAIASTYDSDFLGRVVEPGAVALLTAEDSDTVINRRYNAIIKQTAVELGIEYGDAHAAAEKNLLLATTNDREGITLFKVDKFRDAVKPTKYYGQLLEFLAKTPDLRLVVIDTKIQYSPVDEIDNVAATQEIRYYERLARATNAAVLLLHHTNKAARGDSSVGNQAYRGGSAAYDAVRFAFYLRSASPKELEAQGIDTDEPHNYLILENTKNNYLPIAPTMLLERRGHCFAGRTLTARTKEDKAAEAMAEAVKVLEIMRGLSAPAPRRDIEAAVRARPDGDAVRVAAALQLLEREGLVEKAKAGACFSYAATAKGLEYKV